MAPQWRGRSRSPSRAAKVPSASKAPRTSPCNNHTWAERAVRRLGLTGSSSIRVPLRVSRRAQRRNTPRQDRSPAERGLTRVYGRHAGGIWRASLSPKHSRALLCSAYAVPEVAKAAGRQSHSSLLLFASPAAAYVGRGRYLRINITRRWHEMLLPGTLAAARAEGDPQVPPSLRDASIHSA